MKSFLKTTVRVGLFEIVLFSIYNQEPKNYCLFLVSPSVSFLAHSSAPRASQVTTHIRVPTAREYMIMTALSQFYVLVICFQLVVVGRSWSLWPSKKPLLDSTETSKNIFKQTCTERLVYLDLGANWANTLRLYKDYDFCVNNRSDWEIYGFEAMPLIIPFAENFVKFLNGHARRPHLDLPPLTSEHELWHFASKHDCHLVPPVTNEKKCHAG